MQEPFWVLVLGRRPEDVVVPEEEPPQNKNRNVREMEAYWQFWMFMFAACVAVSLYARLN